MCARKSIHQRNTMKAMGMCLKVSIAVIKYHDQKQVEKERISFILQFSDHTLSLKKVEQELKAGN